MNNYPSEFFTGILPKFVAYLHTSLQDICRRAVFPPDNGYKLMQTIKQSNKKKIFASSNASLRNGRSTQAQDPSTATSIASPLVEVNCKASQQLP
jgi:hypothetical protein